MTILCVSDGPNLVQRLAHLTGQRFVKSALEGETSVSYNLQGTLYLSKSGWILLSVPNALARGVFSAMKEPGIELPSSEGDAFNAHITVMRPEEIALIGGPDKITERGKQFSYSLGRFKEMEPDNWPGVAKVWVIVIHSTELQMLRRSYALSSLPNEGKYDFHLTCAVRKRGVLGRNDTSKES